MDRKYYRKSTYMKEQEETQQPTEPKKEEKKEEQYVYNPSDYSFENVIKIFITKMNGGKELMMSDSWISLRCT